MTALLEARNVTKRFGGGLFKKQYTLAVDNVSLSVGGDTPTVTAIAGESGSGKTTLARMLLNMLEPTEGSVEYKGKSLSSLSQRERKEFRREVQAIFQDPFEVFNPFYKVDAVLTTPANKFNIGDVQSGAAGNYRKCPGDGRIAPQRNSGQVSASAERRPAATSDGCKGDVDKAVRDTGG